MINEYLNYDKDELIKLYQLFVKDDTEDPWGAVEKTLFIRQRIHDFGLSNDIVEECDSILKNYEGFKKLMAESTREDYPQELIDDGTIEEEDRHHWWWHLHLK